MGTGYTRNDTANNIADGNVINAADFDGEYDAIEAAFNSSTGHTHDGTAAEGGPITVLGPSQEFVASASSVAPSTNAGLDLGTASLKFKDLYIDGTAYIDGLGGNLLIDTTNALQFRDTALSISSSVDGQLDIAADTTAKITSPEVIVSDDFRLQSDAAILTFGADDDVTVTHVADTGLDAQAASGFTLRLQTGDTTVEAGNTLGKISFNAPDEASGTDAILVGAEIEAAAEDTFSSTVNSTALVFKTNTSAAATERMRIKSDGDILFKGASYDLTWDTSAHALTTSTSNGDLNITPHGTGSVVITGDLDVDNINIDGNTISSTDTNGNINITPDGTGQVIIGGGFVPSEIALTSTDAGATKGPQLDIFRDSATPADGDAIGYIDFSGDDSGNNKTVYASILAEATDVTDTTEDGTLKFNTMVAGTDTTILTVNADGLTVGGGLTLNADLDVEEVKFQSTANAKVKVVSSTTANSILMLGDTDDNDIGMIDYDNADNSMRFVTNTAEAMRIDASGHVGIGTTSTSGYLLNLSDTGSTNIKFDTGEGGYAVIGENDGGDVYIQADDGNTSANSIIVFQIDDTEMARLTSDGEMGLGTSSISDVKLQINKGGSDTTGDGHIGFGGSSTPLWALRFGASDFDFRFDRSYGGWVGTPVISIRRYNGNVGIGTSDATEKLSVVGNISLDATSGTNSGIRNIEFRNTNSSGYDVSMIQGRTGANIYEGELSFQTKDGGGTMAERMNIDSAGHVTMPYQPSFSGRQSTGSRSIGATGWITIEVDTELWDTNNDFNTSTYRFTAPVDGKYLTMHSVQLENNSSVNWVYLYPLVNGSTSIPDGSNHSDFTPTGTYWTTNYSAILNLSAGDYVEWYIRMVGTSLNLKGSNESSYSIQLLS